MAVKILLMSLHVWEVAIRGISQVQADALTNLQSSVLIFWNPIKFVILYKRNNPYYHIMRKTKVCG